MKKRKKIAILGSTGSIGTQTIDVISQHPDLFEATVLIAGSRVDKLIEQARVMRPRRAVIAMERHYPALREALEPMGIEVAAGHEAILESMRMPYVDTVVTATVGYSGLAPTIEAIKAGKDIALANKETLVVAGSVVTELLKKSKSRVVPVDSEHSAIYQCLVGETPESVRRLIITASGGPFRTLSYKELQSVTVKDALHHPNWSMGAKITIDSATMMNKAFEIIEAHWLFGIAPERIMAVVHPQSIVHSMVEFVDGAVKAQLGLPDMRLPIRYALGEAHRLSSPDEGLRLEDYAHMTFEVPDEEKFPAITLAHTTLERKGNTACVINAANEVAVAAFLEERIGFLDIYPTIIRALESMPYVENPTLDDYVTTNAETRRYTEGLLRR